MMTINSQVSPFQIDSIGSHAFECLTSSRRGEVLTAVSQAVYLLTEQNELLWLTSGTSPMHRRGLHGISPIPDLVAGIPYEVRDHILVTGSGVTLDFSHPQIWKAPIPPAGDAVAVARLPELLTSVYGSFLDWPKPAGLGNLIPALLRIANRESPAPFLSPGDIFSLAAWPAVAGIVQSCLAHDFRPALDHASDLVGLGMGLTPSGDDFLGGLFFCLHLLRHIYPASLGVENFSYSNFIPQCKSLTNQISFTLLKDHADGHTLEPLHRFANALLAGQPLDQLLPFAGELVAVGHSTGWDLLTGFMAGMFVTFPIPFSAIQHERKSHGYQTEDRKSK